MASKFRSFAYRPISVLCFILVFALAGLGQQTTTQSREQEEQRQQEEQVKQEATQEEHQKAEEQLKQEEKQRVLGIIPAFNSSNIQNAVRLTPGQKMHLAFKSATDPFTFLAAGIDAGINQLQDDYHGYGQGMAGYSKRFGASYGDTFNGTMLGNAILPILFHQDPRYFRKGTGSVTGRIWYAALTTIRCKGDNGHWQPNYSNIAGNMLAGTISNLYYPDGDRGIQLTVKRAFTVSAEGVIGAMFFEFWPDISHHFAKKHKTKT